MTISEVLEPAREDRQDFRDLSESTKLNDVVAVMKGCGYGREIDTLVSALGLANRVFKYEKHITPNI